MFRVTRSLARSPRTGALHPFYGIVADAWVNVVALTAAGEVVMVRQWRHGSREVTLEIPGGIVDPGESPEQAAVRELLEETGFGGGTPVALGSVNPNPALFGNRVHTFLVRDVARLGEVQNASTEETSVVLVPRAELAAPACAARRSTTPSSWPRCSASSSRRAREDAARANAAAVCRPAHEARRLPRRLPEARRRDATSSDSPATSCSGSSTASGATAGSRS